MPPRVNPGDPLSIHAGVYNHAVALYERAMGAGGTFQRRVFKSRDSRILIQNSSGSNLVRFSVVGLSTPVILPNADLDSDFFNSPCLATRLPTLDDTPWKWGVIQEPINNGEIGECLISGVTPVKVGQPSTDEDFCEPNGTYASLDPTDCGICRILWRESGSGLKWALVNIG